MFCIVIDSLTTTGGVGTSRMLSKLAAGLYKPNQQSCVLPHHVASFLGPMPPRALPGVGRALNKRLKMLHVRVQLVFWVLLALLTSYSLWTCAMRLLD